MNCTILPCSSEIFRPEDTPTVSHIVSQAAHTLDFDIILEFIDAARTRAVTAVNTTLIELYWSIGVFIVQKISADG